MNSEKNTTEIEGIFIRFWYPVEPEKNARVELTLEEKSQGALIGINYNVSGDYALSLGSYIQKYFVEGETQIKVKIKGKLEEDKYKGVGLIRKLE